jgi:glutamate 5-kinase
MNTPAPTPNALLEAAPAHGTIFVDPIAAAELRTQGTLALSRRIVDVACAFLPGEAVYVVLRGVDGGQRVVAKGIARCAAAELRGWLRDEAAAPLSRDLVLAREQVINY